MQWSVDEIVFWICEFSGFTFAANFHPSDFMQAAPNALKRISVQFALKTK